MPPSRPLPNRQVPDPFRDSYKTTGIRVIQAYRDIVGTPEHPAEVPDEVSTYFELNNGDVSDGIASFYSEMKRDTNLAENELLATKKVKEIQGRHKQTLSLKLDELTANILNSVAFDEPQRTEKAQKLEKWKNAALSELAARHAEQLRYIQYNYQKIRSRKAQGKVRSRLPDPQAGVKKEEKEKNALTLSSNARKGLDDDFMKNRSGYIKNTSMKISYNKETGDLKITFDPTNKSQLIEAVKICIAYEAMIIHVPLGAKTLQTSMRGADVETSARLKAAAKEMCWDAMTGGFHYSKGFLSFIKNEIKEMLDDPARRAELITLLQNDPLAMRTCDGFATPDIDPRIFGASAPGVNDGLHLTDEEWAELNFHKRVHQLAKEAKAQLQNTEANEDPNKRIPVFEKYKKIQPETPAQQQRPSPFGF